MQRVVAWVLKFLSILLLIFKNFKHMKKRHEQKLIILSIAMLLLFNIPLILIFNLEGEILGFPTFYFFIFFIWLLAIIISYIILKRHYE